MKRMFALLVATALFLVACGGQAPAANQSGQSSGQSSDQAASAPTAPPRPTSTPRPTAVPKPKLDPEQRVKAFFKDFSDALSDPDIAEQATQDEWTEKIVSHALPSQQDDAKESVAKALAEIGNADLSEMTGQPNLDARMTMAFVDLETELANQTDTTAEVLLVDGAMRIEIVGEDAEQLKEQMGGTLSQDISIQDLQEGEDLTLNLELVDGVWYITDLSEDAGLFGGTTEGSSEEALPTEEAAEEATTEETATETLDLSTLEVSAAGQAVEIGNLTMTVHGMSEPEGDEFASPKAGHRYVAVDVSFENTGTEQEIVSTLLQMSLVDQDGTRYPVDLMASVVAGETPDGDVAPGSTLRGVVGFEVPQDAGDLVFVFETFFDGIVGVALE